MPEKDDCASKSKKGEVVFGMLVPALNDPSKVVKPGEEPFAFPALVIVAQPAAIVEGGFGSATTRAGPKAGSLLRPIARVADRYRRPCPQWRLEDDERLLAP